MANIDVSLIEGYADMSPEEKIKALEGFEIEEPDYSGYVRKDQFDKASSEVAEWKKKYKAQLSQGELDAEERKVEFENMKSQLEALKKEKSISQYKAEFLAQGYDEKLASDTAEAMADGDMKKVFANNKKFLDGYAKSLEAKILNDTPKPGGEGAGESNEIKTKKDFLNASYEKQMAFKALHPNDWQTILK